MIKMLSDEIHIDTVRLNKSCAAFISTVPMPPPSHGRLLRGPFEGRRRRFERRPGPFKARWALEGRPRRPVEGRPGPSVKAGRRAGIVEGRPAGRTSGGVRVFIRVAPEPYSKGGLSCSIIFKL